jgi:hypothetical protein
LHGTLSASLTRSSAAVAACAVSDNKMAMQAIAGSMRIS